MFYFGEDLLFNIQNDIIYDGDMKVIYKYNKEGEYNIMIIVCVFEYLENRIVYVIVWLCGLLVIYFFNSYIEKDF